MSCCEQPLGLTYLRALIARRHDIAVYPADALDFDNPPEDVYFYRPAEILVPRDEVGLFNETAAKLGIRVGPADQASDAPHPSGIARFFVGATTQLDTIIDKLVRAADGRLHVAPNHVLFTCEEWLFSPATEPSVAAPLLIPGGSPEAGEENAPPGEVTVAVIDSGLPEGYIHNPVLADVDAVEEEPWLYEGSHPVLTFPQGHGSFVSGVVRLAAPRAQVLSYLAADGDGTTDEWSLGYQIALAIESEPNVVNLSLGTTSRHDEPLLGLRFLGERAVAEGGPIVVAAAGNLEGSRPFWPAAEPWAIGVAAVYAPREGNDPVKAWFSNFGPWVDVCAVGVDVHSAYEQHPYRPMHDPSQLRYFEGAARWSGTSFATPYVAAAVARLLASDPGLTRNGAIERFALGTYIPEIGFFVE